MGIFQELRGIFYWLEFYVCRLETHWDYPEYCFTVLFCYTTSLHSFSLCYSFIFQISGNQRRWWIIVYPKMKYKHKSYNWKYFSVMTLSKWSKYWNEKDDILFTRLTNDLCAEINTRKQQKIHRWNEDRFYNSNFPRFLNLRFLKELVV